MIVPMKKLSLVTMKRLERETLDQLRTIGVLHVERDVAASEKGEALREEISRLHRALSVIPVPDGTDEQERSQIDGKQAVDEALNVAESVESLAEKRSDLGETRERLLRTIERMEPWGEVSPERIATLEAARVRVRLYVLTPDEYENAELPGVLVLAREKNVIRLLSIAIGDETFPEAPPPFAIAEKALSALREDLTATERALADLAGEIEQLAVHRPLIRSALDELADALEYAGVHASLARNDELSWLTGYLPHDRVSDVKDAAQRHGWGILIRDPEPEDPVPTEVRNPKAIRIIKPVFQLLGTIPGYREIDISFFFLLFFTVFFAMIIGDGGYGAILFAGTLYATIKTRVAGRAIGEGLILMLVLSVAAIVWGAITGNWFGYAPFAELPFLNAFVVPQIATTNPASAYAVQYVCFVLGTIHISIAHIWGFLRAFAQKPRIAALAQLGWLSLVLGLYYLVLQLVLDPQLTMPPWALPMIGGGLGTVIVFGAQESGKNFFVGIGKGLAGIITTALDSVSAFSDIISYIRLFAVGLASLAIAEAFNEMAAGINTSLGGAVGVVVAAIVLMLGHTLNLAMGALSVIVHGVRLNMLEFSGHLGMEWTGVQYAPFKTRGKQGEVA